MEECRNIIVRIMEAEQKQPEKISFVRIKEISRVVHRVLKKDMDNFREAFKELLNENFLENVTGKF